MVLVVVTDFVEFCGYPLFLAVLADKMKEGKLIHDWLVVLPTVSFCECLFAIIYDGDGISEW